MGADTGSYCTGDEGCQTKLCYHSVCFRYNPHLGFTGISDDGYTLYGVGSEHDLQAVWNSYGEYEAGEHRLMYEDGTVLEDWEYNQVQH